MSKIGERKFELNDIESIETKVDRLNNRILEIINSSKISFTDSDILSPTTECFIGRTLEDTEISINEKFEIYEE